MAHHYLFSLFAQIAQLVEQGTENPCVLGSIPSLGTIKEAEMLLFFYIYILPSFFTLSLYIVVFILFFSFKQLISSFLLKFQYL